MVILIIGGAVVFTSFGYVIGIRRGYTIGLLDGIAIKVINTVQGAKDEDSV